MKKFTYLLTCVATFLLTSGLRAEDEPTAPMPPRDGGMYQTMIMIALALVFGYFIVWRPEQKRRKAAEEQRNSLKKGDRVVAMGIIGNISSIKEQTVVLRMVDGSKIEMLKAAISETLPALSDEEAKKNAKEDSE
jgi:preprotein translocase subunit YajC